MKNTIFSFSLLVFQLCAVTHIFTIGERTDTFPVSSNFLPVLNENHTWNVCEYDSYSPRTFCARYKMGSPVNGQNGKTYQKVLMSYDSTGNQWSGTSFFVREEEGRLWVLDTALFEEEILLMDMNLEKGDQFLIETGYDKNRKLLVSNTDTLIDLKGVMRKVIYLNCGEEEYYMLRWIEGIGPDIGVFDAHLGLCLLDFPLNNLYCFFSGDNHNWQVEYAENCWATTVKSQNNQEDIQCTVFPNPGQSLIFIETSFPNSGNVEIRIIDEVGVTHLNQKGLASKVVLDVGFLPPGIYTVYVSEPGNKSHYRKWMKL